MVKPAAMLSSRARAHCPHREPVRDHEKPSGLSVTFAALRPWLLLLLLLCPGVLPAAEADSTFPYAMARILFPEAERIGAPEGSPPAAPVYGPGADAERLVGYVFLTGDVVQIPAYSGRPIQLLVGLDLMGRIRGVRIIQHEEPILAAGVSEARLADFIAQYQGKPADGGILVGARQPGHATVDAISGATITVMVINATINRAVRRVAASRGITPAAWTEDTPASPPASSPATQGEWLGGAKGTKFVPGQTRLAKPGLHAPLPAPAAVAPPPVAAVPAAPVEAPASASPSASGEAPAIWPSVWRQRVPEIVLLGAGLLGLTGILLFQDYLARHPRLLRRIRLGFLLYTLLFVGWYALGQLSIINVLTFVQAVMHQFSWDTFLIDPMLFLLWSFVAVTLLLWGRGVYCGWLCPFGALQELVFQLGQRFRLPSFQLPQVVHERLLALKYVIMLGLFGLSLQSMGWAIRAAEIEPFKTAITLHFQREWGYVAFALGLILLSLFNRKAYCKYLCPLGAALVIPGRFHTFEWLRRRKECGKPCQVCAVECEVQAIRPTGEIVINECHHCLDCQVTYYDEHKCPPLVERRKRRERGGRARELARGMGEALEATLKDIPVRVEPKPDMENG